MSCKKSIAYHYKKLSDADKSIPSMCLLKFFFLFDFSIFDLTFLGEFHHEKGGHEPPQGGHDQQDGYEQPQGECGQQQGIKITKNCCGFISFAFKIHYKLQEIEYKQGNAKNTYQSSMEYIYCTKTGGSKFKETHFNNTSLLKEVSVQNSKVYPLLATSQQKKRALALLLPNLPIVVSLSKNQSFAIFDNVHEHALQITSSTINSIFPDT